MIHFILLLCLLPQLTLVNFLQMPEPVNQHDPIQPMTKEEILAFLSQRLGENPFQHPDREKIKIELGELIKKRGVDFHYSSLSDFANKLANYGASSEITFPIDANYGVPTKRNWLMGSWSMDIVGAPVDFTRKDRVYRQGEIGAKGGLLVINTDNTYSWQAYSTNLNADLYNGIWRDASAAEMKYQGGDGIVLVAAKSNWDWIVMQERAAPQGEWVRVSEITTRQMREFGTRRNKPKP